MSDPVSTVLDRLDRVRKSGSGWYASCPTPFHERGDRSRGLSIAEGRDGRAILNCHAGCETTEVLAAIGLEWKQLFPPRVGMPPPRPKVRPYKLPKKIARALLTDPMFPYEWHLAKLLAVRHPIQAQRDLLGSWDYLAERGYDVPRVWETTKIIRSAAFWRYARAEDNRPNPVERAVVRLLAEVDRGR